MKRPAKNGIIAAVALILIVAGAGMGLGKARRVTPVASPVVAPAPPTLPTLIRDFVRPVPAPDASRGVPALAPAASGTDQSTNPAIVAAEEFRLDVCDCESRACLDHANRRYARGMGLVTAGSAGEASRAEMHAANECIAHLLTRLRDAGP